MNTHFTNDSADDELAALAVASEIIAAHEAQERADFEVHLEEEAMIKPAVEAAGLTPFVAWLNAQDWTIKSQHAYDFAIEYALSISRQ